MRLSLKRQEPLTRRERIGSPPVFWWVRVGRLCSFLCCVVCFIFLYLFLFLFLVVLYLLVVSVSGLFIRGRPFGFLGYI